MSSNRCDVGVSLCVAIHIVYFSCLLFAKMDICVLFSCDLHLQLSDSDCSHSPVKVKEEKAEDVSISVEFLSFEYNLVHFTH